MDSNLKRQRSGSDGFHGYGGRDRTRGFRDRDRSAAGMSSSSKWAGGYRPQVADESVPRPHLPGERARGGRGGTESCERRPFSSPTNSRFSSSHRSGTAAAASPSRGGRSMSSASRSTSGAAKPRDIVVILEKAGILLGNMGLVDAYDRAATTEIANESLKDVRPDIVHQCLLALFDSDLAYQHRLRVYISLFVRQGKVIEVSPALRPPRTYARFRGLMSALLRDGRICSTDGQVLMRLMPGSVAPIIPHGAEVVGLTNSLASPIVTATQLAQQAAAAPVDDSLQGGIKHVAAFYCISCTDDCNLDGIDYITRSVCLSAYPMTAHVQCARVCEGHTRVEPASSSSSGAATVGAGSGQPATGSHPTREPPQRNREVFPADQEADNDR
ncbi:hypothetical protein LSCM1_03579 [Leishmania martiniquensis]|uniref:EMG1/NEP1 methyltransferase n=1 Tax=Leishmania martiniquensis TaxID=1580590 RepID=A0A836KGP9_9TRYP|nr:hypothetical protein LSCM1_03579 [Leishmania martiniquensis]